MSQSTKLPLYITLATFVLAFVLCAAQYPAMASTRVVANLLTDNAFLGISILSSNVTVCSCDVIFQDLGNESVTVMN